MLPTILILNLVLCVTHAGASPKPGLEDLVEKLESRLRDMEMRLEETEARLESKEQACKSSEDTHLTGYTRFEKVFGLGKLWVKKVFRKKHLKKTL